MNKGFSGRLRRGQSLVEFALVLPLLALLLFAIIQYGFIFNAYMTLRHGAHVTARTLSLAGASTNNVATTACDAIKPVLDCTQLATPVVTSATIDGKNAVKVQLLYNMPIFIRFVVPNAQGNSLPVRAEAIYRRE